MRHARGTPSAAHNPKIIAVVLRAAEVLDHLHGAGRDLGIRELHDLTGLPKASIYRVLASLTAVDLVAYNPDTQQYSIGPKILEYGLTRLRGLDLRQAALPYLRQLRDETGETATVSALLDGVRIYLDQVESLQEIRQTIELGRRVQLYSGGSGKAILAFFPPDKLEAYLQKIELRPLTERTITDVERLRRELAEIRSLGYARSNGERVSETASVAAPVFNRFSEVIGCISVCGPNVRFTQAVAAHHGPLVRAAALATSRVLGYRPDTVGSKLEDRHP